MGTAFWDTRMEGMPPYINPENIQTLAYLLIVIGAWVGLGFAVYFFHRR